MTSVITAADFVSLWYFAILMVLLQDFVSSIRVLYPDVGLLWANTTWILQHMVITDPGVQYY